MVYVPKIKKDIWAGYTPPKKDEIFSSWFFRLAQSHLLKSQSFSHIVLEGYSLWNRDNDLYSQEFVTNILEKNTPLNLHQINNLFLSSYEGSLFEKLNTKGFTVGIISLKMYHRKRKGNGMMYCPSCMKNNPYYRKHWRVFYSLACLDCGTELNDHCPHCKNPIVFHRLEQGFKSEINRSPMNFCSYCGYDISLNPIKASIQCLKFQKKINSYLKDGHTEYLGYSHLYFEMLYKISSLISRESDLWGRLRKACKQEFGDIPVINGKYFYLTTLQERKDILLLAFKLLDDLDLLIYLVKKYNIRLSELTKEKTIPFYYLEKLKF